MDETKEERRKRLVREASTRWKVKNPERVAAYAKTRRDANLDERRRIDRDAKTKWREENRELSRSRSNAYAAEHRTAEKIRTAVWRRENPEEVKRLSIVSQARRKERWAEFLAWERARYRREYLSNPAKYKARCAALRAKKLRATPAWCDKKAIVALYREARRLTLETGIPHDVDHIIPLRGKSICGLHIPLNLQIITATANRRKHNSFIHDAEHDNPDRFGISATAAV